MAQRRADAWSAMADGTVKYVGEKNYNLSYKGVNNKTTANNIISFNLPVLSDKVVLAFSDRGNCYKLNMEEAACKLSDKGFRLNDFYDEAAEDERPVGFAEEGGDLAGDLLFITEGGMLKRTAREEYTLNKPVYQAIRLNEGDRVLTVEKYRGGEEGETVFFVTRLGNCLNAQMNDIPVQGRISGGVKGIMLAEGDRTVFAKQINGEGEIVLATKCGRFKRVISCQIDPSPRYRKGCRIATFTDKDDEIIYADYVTTPYFLAVADPEGNMVSCDTEDVNIEISSAKGRKLKGRTAGVSAVYSLKFLQ